MAAGTIVLPLATALVSYVLPITNWCRVDKSGEVSFTPPLHCTSALARSDTSLTEDLDDQPHEGHRCMYHHRLQSVSTVSCRGTKGHSYTYGVSPQQVET